MVAGGRAAVQKWSRLWRAAVRIPPAGKRDLPAWLRLLRRSELMQATSGARAHRPIAHLPVEERTPEGKTRISCASPRCAAWVPRPCQSPREAQFWYDRHITQPLTYHL
jgi:hypothetical protein